MLVDFVIEEAAEEFRKCFTTRRISFEDLPKLAEVVAFNLIVMPDF